MSNKYSHLTLLGMQMQGIYQQKPVSYFTWKLSDDKPCIKCRHVGISTWCCVMNASKSFQVNKHTHATILSFSKGIMCAFVILPQSRFLSLLALCVNFKGTNVCVLLHKTSFIYTTLWNVHQKPDWKIDGG